MTTEKSAQNMLEVAIPPMDMDMALDTSYDSDNDENNENLMVIEYDDPDMDGEGELVFHLSSIPGAEDESEILVEPDESDLEVSEPEEVEVEEKDPWDWSSGGAKNFLQWLHSMMTNVPRHSGRDTTGLEKAIAYFEALDREITKAMRVDYHNEINSAKAEEARAQIEDGLERLVDRLERVRTTKYKRHQKKSRKKADNQSEMFVKEAQKHTHVGGIVVTVPLLISRIARTCINGMVSGGHDIERMFTKLSEKYDLTKREQAELLQLLADMGYPVRRDRGFDLDEDFDASSSDNFDFNANYPG